MNETGSNTGSGTIKRPLSRSSVVSDATTQETGRSQRPSGSLASYRFTHLANVEVYIHVEPSKDIQHAIVASVKAVPSDDSQKQLKSASQAFSHGCAAAARAAVGEDDSLHHFFTALKTIQPSNICLREKADWSEGLKPYIPPPGYNLDFLANDSVDYIGVDEDQEEGNASNQRPPKRVTYMSPRFSTPNAMAPPPIHIPPSRKQLLIKTPRPDMSIGRKLNTIASTSSQSLSSVQAQRFLKQLQNQMIAREPRMILEPALISVPALRASDLTFPFAVVEGTAYSTGRQIFEAENRAAIAGACGLKIQLCLDELVKRATSCSDSDSAPSTYRPALFFSICTKGPLHELWAHWTSAEGGVRRFNMTLLKHCHGVLQEGVEDFMIAVDNMLRWGPGEFIDSVVERLEKVAKKATLHSMVK